MGLSNKLTAAAAGVSMVFSSGAMAAEADVVKAAAQAVRDVEFTLLGAELGVPTANWNFTDTKTAELIPERASNIAAKASAVPQTLRSDFIGGVIAKASEQRRSGPNAGDDIIGNIVARAGAPSMKR